jgi:hypothetical protein
MCNNWLLIWVIIYLVLRLENMSLECAEISVGGLIMVIPNNLCGGMFIKNNL